MKRIMLIVLAATAVAGCGQSGSKDGGKPAAKPAPPEIAGPLPALPAWAAGYMGKLLPEAFPQTGTCVGNTDKVLHRYAGPPAGAEIVGWGWDSQANRRVEHVLLVDEDMRVVGAGEGARKRLDVPRKMPKIQDNDTGWRGLVTAAAGDVIAFGVIADGHAVCPLGRVAL